MLNTLDNAQSYSSGVVTSRSSALVCPSDVGRSASVCPAGGLESHARNAINLSIWIMLCRTVASAEVPLILTDRVPCEGVAWRCVLSGPLCTGHKLLSRVHKFLILPLRTLRRLLHGFRKL